MARPIFEDLFVLELANNHWGKLERGLKIIREFGQVVRHNNVRAAIKLQFRDVDRFIHHDYINRDDIRYIKKTIQTKMSKEEYQKMVQEIRKFNCIPMATPFDEASVDLCVELGVQIIKVASSDINDWPLLEKIASTKKPVAFSTGGSSIKDIDDVVQFFTNRNIPLALNHCVSLYPSEDHELELNQIDFLRDRYPNVTIGLSSHEYHDWNSSLLISYAKGARTWERHIDIDYENVPVSTYCSHPHQVDQWFKTYLKAREMCGAPGTQLRMCSKKEIEYLDGLVRGVYAAKDMAENQIISDKDIYMAIPLLKGQISVRELIAGEMVKKAVKKDQPIMIDDIDSPYANIDSLKEQIYSRGLSPTPPDKTPPDKNCK